jgi:hypothetical protein
LSDEEDANFVSFLLSLFLSTRTSTPNKKFIFIFGPEPLKTGRHNQTHSVATMNHIAVIVALAFFTKLIFALSPNYPFDQLPRPVHQATFTGEANDHAYELNGTVQASTTTPPSSFIQSND